MKAIRSFVEAEIEYDDALAVSPDPIAFRRDVNDALSAIAQGIITHRLLGRSGKLRACFVRLRQERLAGCADHDGKIKRR